MTSTNKHHDSIYRQLFSLPEMVAALSESCFESSWRDAIDWERVRSSSTRWVRERDGAQRENDLIWQLPCSGSGDLFLYLMIELQSAQDNRMLMRIDEYSQMFRKEHWDRLGVGPGPRQSKLPRMVPLVLYTGDGRWRAPTDLEQVTDPWGPGLEPLAGIGSTLRYAVVSAESARPVEGREPNVVDALLGLLGAKQAQESVRWLAALREAAEREENPAVERLLRRWLMIEFLSRRMPNTPKREVEELWDKPQEARKMIGTFEDQWLAQGRAEGEAIGEAKGKAEGEAKGREALRETLMRLITRRFGASLAQSVAPRIQAIGSVEALNEIVELVALDATADSLPGDLDRVAGELPAPA